jgi:hypothetical protein
VDIMGRPIYFLLICLFFALMVHIDSQYAATAAFDDNDNLDDWEYDIPEIFRYQEDQDHDYEREEEMAPNRPSSTGGTSSGRSGSGWTRTRSRSGSGSASPSSPSSPSSSSSNGSKGAKRDGGSNNGKQPQQGKGKQKSKTGSKHKKSQDVKGNSRGGVGEKEKEKEDNTHLFADTSVLHLMGRKLKKDLALVVHLLVPDAFRSAIKDLWDEHGGWVKTTLVGALAPALNILGTLLVGVGRASQTVGEKVQLMILDVRR